MSTSKKFDIDEQRKLLAYIRGECLRGTDQKMIRQKLVQAGWAEGEVVRLIEQAVAMPQGGRRDRVKVMQIEPILIVDKDGNLKLKREFVDAEVRKKRKDEETHSGLKVYTDLLEPYLSEEKKILWLRHCAWVLLGGVVLWNAGLLMLRYRS